jgi:hypothetical protein
MHVPSTVLTLHGKVHKAQLCFNNQKLRIRTKRSSVAYTNTCNWLQRSLYLVSSHTLSVQSCILHARTCRIYGNLNTVENLLAIYHYMIYICLIWAHLLSVCRSRKLYFCFWDPTFWCQSLPANPFLNIFCASVRDAIIISCYAVCWGGN